MSDARKALSRIRVPLPSDGFRDEILRRMHEADRTAARRWRLAAIIASAIAAGSLSTAGVLALRTPTARTVDQTLQCAVPERGGVNPLDLFARVSNSPIKRLGKVERRPASLGAVVGLNTIYAGLSVYEVVNGKLRFSPYIFDHTSCQAAPQRISLTTSGLPRVALLRGTSGADFKRECWVAPTVSIRLRVGLNAQGTPTSAALALRSGNKQKPVAYVEWTPTRISIFATPTCMTP